MEKSKLWFVDAFGLHYSGYRVIGVMEDFFHTVSEDYFLSIYTEPEEEA